MNQTEEKSFLLVREWVAVLFMLFILALLSTLSFTSKNKTVIHKNQFIEVKVTGEVEQEILLKMPFGSTVGDIVQQVSLTPMATLDALHLDAPVKQGQILVIPKKGVVSIYLKGAVEKEGVLHLDEGATFKDLRENIALQENADASSLKRKKRKLKDGEMVVIAFKH